MFVEQLFLLAPGFNSFITSSTTIPGIPVTNNADLASAFKNYVAATFIRSTNRVAFIDGSNNVYYYDTTGKVQKLMNILSATQPGLHRLSVVY